MSAPAIRIGWLKSASLCGRGIALFILLSLVGCSRKAATDDANVISENAQRGPLSLVATARPKQVWLADPIHVELTFTAPPDHDVRLPGAEAFGELNVTAGDPIGPRPTADGRSEWKRNYTVRSLSAGELEIPPLVAKYAKKSSDGSDPKFDSELALGTLHVEVRSALTSQDSVEAPRDITGTLLPVRHWTKRDVLAAAAAMIAVLGVVALVVWLIRRRVLRGVPPELPEVWALRALSGLSTTAWSEQREWQPFFYRVSEIVRQYIERKFNLTAPEMTTEEFLTALARGKASLPYDSARLRDFLETCDRVKYAAFQPRREDGDETLAAARAFIHTTAAAALASARSARTDSERAA